MSAMDAPSFADLLRHYRRRRRLTQEELAERAGVSPATIGLLERGLTQAPQKATVQLLSAALRLTSDQAAAFLETARRSRRGAGDATDPDSGTMPKPPALSPRGALPIPLTAIIGRERDEAALLDLIDRPETRLLTLTGPAGVGKSRLALRVAARLRREAGRDVAFVGLIPAREHERVLPAIAQALGIPDNGMLPPRESLVRALWDRHLVLLLDNFEHVLAAAPAVVDLLIACPRVTALVTSRSPLNVRGERCFAVRPLTLPGPAQLDSLDALRRVPTVALFLELARARQPDFTLATLDDARLVAAICARLDGLPLAIELAAARVASLGLRRLHNRLAEPAFLGVLAGGPRDLAGHQRTMRSAIAWSYDLLDEGERRLFRRLGVFVGGASMEAVEAVCGDEGEPGGPDHLASLVEQNLVRQEQSPTGEMRFGMLETIAECAGEQLEASGEANALRDRHARYFQTFAERAAPQLRGAGQAAALARLEGEHDNLRVALRWTRERPDVALGIRLAAALLRFWLLHGPLGEGRAHLDAMLALPLPDDDPARASLRAQALYVAGSLAWKQSDYERATPLLEEALHLARASGQMRVAAGALHDLANVATERSEFARAVTLYEESLALKRGWEDHAGVAMTLRKLVELELMQGHFARARALAEESLALSRQLGDTAGIAHLLADLGVAARHEGDGEQAESLLEQALALHRELMDLWGIGRTLHELAALMRARGERDKARDLLRESLTWYRTLADPLSIVECLESFAGLAGAEGQPERAVRLFATAAAQREALGAPHSPVERDVVEGEIAALRAALGEPSFEAAWVVGRARPLEESLAELERA